jgi:hypothetical protein
LSDAGSAANDARGTPGHPAGAEEPGEAKPPKKAVPRGKTGRGAKPATG